MALTLNLPEDVADRLDAEARRRGITIEELVAELVAARLPVTTDVDALEAFIGSGASGNTEPFDTTADRSEQSASKVAKDA